MLRRAFGWLGFASFVLGFRNAGYFFSKLSTPALTSGTIPAPEPTLRSIYCPDDIEPPSPSRAGDGWSLDESYPPSEKLVLSPRSHKGRLDPERDIAIGLTKLHIN